MRISKLINLSLLAFYQQAIATGTTYKVHVLYVITKLRTELIRVYTQAVRYRLYTYVYHTVSSSYGAQPNYADST